MLLEGEICRLRAVEPRDAGVLCVWENDPEVWLVSGTSAPFSRHAIERFIEEQQYDIYASRQLRLIVENRGGEAVGAVDIFEFDPANLRAGVGILIYGREHRGRGYAAESLRLVGEYARDVLHLHQLWCNVGAENEASLRLFVGAGYERVGVKRDWQRTRDGYADEILMQKIL